MNSEPHDELSMLDGRLIRLLDGELDAEERRRLDTLLESSPEARARLDELRMVSVRLSEGLARDPVGPAPPLELPARVPDGRGRMRSYRTQVRWRAAAGVALLLAGGLVVEPVRAFLVSGVSRVIEALQPEDAALVDAGPTPAAGGPSTVSFAPGGPVFTVSIGSVQSSGTLRIEAVEGAVEVTASVVDGDAESLLVLPSELRVVNGPESAADYRIAVPAALERVEVRVAGRTVATMAPREGEQVRDVELGTLPPG